MAKPNDVNDRTVDLSHARQAEAAAVTLSSARGYASNARQSNPDGAGADATIDGPATPPGEGD